MVQLYMLNNRVPISLKAICFYLPKINAPNSNQQFSEYQNQNKRLKVYLFIIQKY